VNTLPREARDGIMRAWLAILREKHPEFTWIAVEQESSESESLSSSDSSGISDAETVKSEDVAQAA
jgi:hypothetical protein